jgi:metal-responsive CopG/Arc/MetJ family transcriptional regulator
MTKRKPNPQRGGRKRTGNERHTVSLPPALWQFVDVQGGKNRSERLAVALEYAIECQGWEQPSL